MGSFNYFNYFTEIEEYFWRKRGAHLLVSPLDWAIVETWQKAADAMYGEHGHLRDYGDLMETLTKDEYAKDPKRAPADLYGAVATRANGMLRLQKDGPSLPENPNGGVQVTTPAPESRNDKRLRDLREGK